MHITQLVRLMSIFAAGTRLACFLAVAMSFAASARTILVPALPVSPYADTEVSRV